MTAAKPLRFALLAATMLGLYGCMSSPADQLESISITKPAPAATQTDKNALAADVAPSDESAIAEQAAADVQLLNKDASAAPIDSNTVAPGSIVIQPKNIAATKNSIFSNADPAARQPMTLDQQAALLAEKNGAVAVTPGLDAAKSSIYAGQVEPITRNDAMPVPDSKSVAEAQELALAGLETPIDATPVDAADVATPETIDVAAAEPLPQYDEIATAPVEVLAKPPKKKRTLADFFGAGDDEEEEGQFDQNRFGQQKKILTTRTIPNMQTAGLADTALPGVNAMFPSANPTDEDHSEDGDDSAGLMKLASLPSMTRVAPNGLWTQTDKVEVSCLRPQLVNMLKFVEDHYKRPVVVTSGFRDVRHNRRAGGVRHSLHTLCAAADIQVQGVSKWELADYLRSIPGRGGVGTYCHTNSVHIDIGGERDWNWRCRRKSRRG